MFSLHFSNSSPGFEKSGKPDEDSSFAEGSFAAVFDGVTLEHVVPYPDPSPARMAADIGIKAAYDCYLNAERRDEKLIHAMFAAADRAIFEYNRKLGVTDETVDYLDKQYAATVGALGFIEDEKLFYGHILDSGVLVFDEHFRPLLDAVFDTDLYDDYVEEIEKRRHFAEGSEEEYAYIRKNLVNNPDVTVHRKHVGFGVLTGEPEANSFVRSGAVALEPGHCIVMYSDGFIPYLHHKDFLKQLAQNPVSEIKRSIKQMEKTSPKLTFERTLVCIRF